MCIALARKIKGQGNLANLRAPNVREHCDRARGGSGRLLILCHDYHYRKLFISCVEIKEDIKMTSC